MYKADKAFQGEIVLILVALTTITLLFIIPDDAYGNGVTPDFSNYPCFNPPCTYELLIGNKSYPITYQVWSESENRSALAQLDSITANETRNSLIVEVTSDDQGALYLTIPKAIFPYEQAGSQLTILFDGKPTNSEQAWEPQWSLEANVIELEFKMDKNTREIEIIGQQLVPEFNSLSAIVVALSIAGIVVWTRWGTGRRFRVD